MKRRMTKAEAKAFKERWALVNAFEEVELRSTPLTEKFRQLDALRASAQSSG